MRSQWKEEFGAEFEVPQAVEEGLKNGSLCDTSWHNDVCPSFAVADGNDGRFVQLWVDHPKAEEREVPEWPRFRVCSGPDAKGEPDTYYEGEDVYRALNVLETKSREVAS